MRTSFPKQVSVLVALAILMLAIVSPVAAVDLPPGDPGAVTAGDVSDTTEAAPPHAGTSSLNNGIQNGTLLSDRFGVTLQLQPTSGGAGSYSFNWASFKPTKNANTVDWIEADWFGWWSTSSTSDHSNVRGYYPSGGEWYDVEAIYFDNDDVNFYVAIVTSVPHYKDYGSGNASVGIYDNRLSGGYWVRPGDLSIDLGLPNTARQERYGVWHYNYGLDIVDDDRSNIENSSTMRSNAVGQDLYRTTSDAGGSNIENPATSDWYTSGPTHNVTAAWEHTNFDPVFKSLTSKGSAAVTYYRYDFALGHLENNAETYIVEATIPRSLFGLDNPGDGDSIRLRWVEGCRNDGNSEDGVIYLDGDVDYPEMGDAPDSTNHYGLAMTYAGGGNGIDAYFPTVADPGATGGGAPYGMCHVIVSNGARVGYTVTSERDADQYPDLDIPNNITPTIDLSDLDLDDGLILPGQWQDGVETSFQYTVTVPAGGVDRTRYANVWFDWNRDGEWDDSSVSCRTAGLTADEHVVSNQVVNVSPGTSVLFTQAMTPCNPVPYADDDAIWVRITLSDEPVETNNVRDEFNSYSYGNNDGTQNWVNSWQEELENGTAGPTGGEVRLDNGRLCIGPGDETPNPGPGARREVNLSGASSATLTFDYEANTNSSDDVLVVQVRNNGTWGTVGIFAGSVSGSFTYDISSYIDTDTDIRFKTQSYYGGDADVFCADNIQVSFSAGVEDGRGPGYCYADGETEDWYFTPQTPTGVEIVSFNAFAGTANVLLTWVSASELDTIGYNLERRLHPMAPGPS